MSSTDKDPRMNDTILNLVNNYKTVSNVQRLYLNTIPTTAKRVAVKMSNGSDAVSSPAKRFKEDESHITFPGSPREFRRLKCDLIESRNYTKELEKQLAQMRTIKKEEQIVYETETKRWKAQADRGRDTIKELESKLDDFRQREVLSRAEINKLGAAHAALKNERDSDIQKLESKLNEMMNNCQNRENDENSQIIKLERQVEDLKMVYNASKNEVDAHKKFVDDLTQKLNEKTNLESELEVKNQAILKLQQQIKKIEFAKESYLEFQQQAKSQNQKLLKYETLEREVQQLRDDNRNLKNNVHSKLLLEEEVYDLRGRLEKLKEQEKKLNTLMITNAQTEMQLEEFRALARSICETTAADSTLPRMLRAVLEKLQNQELALTTEKIQLDSSLSTANHESKVAKDELDKCRTHIVSLDKDLQQAKTQMMRMHRKIQLISGERDSYRKQLDSYEKDLTICVNPASTAIPGGAQMASQFERIKSLESTIDEYRDILQRLENELKVAEGSSIRDDTPIRAEQLQRLQSEMSKLHNENALLRERKDKLEIQLEEYLVGQDSAVGRIVHNENNPLSNILKQRANEKERLEEEVASLKRKIKKLEAGLEASQLGDVTIDHKEIIAMREKLSNAEHSQARLKEYFSQSMQDFRNVVYMLFGFKVDRTQSSQYKITSMYADKSEDQLCFQLSEEGAFNLLENAYSASLHEMVELHLCHQKSVPVFLSSLTLDLFNNKTITKAYEVTMEQDDDDDDDTVDLNDREYDEVVEEDSSDVEHIVDDDDDDDDS